MVDGLDHPVYGTNVTFNQTTVVHKSNNLWYDPVPFELLKTFETVPQVIVDIDGQPAVCHSLDCGFNYTEPSSNITEFSYNETTRKIEAIGNNLPNQTSEIRQITFGQK